MALQAISQSELGGLIAEHHDSLPTSVRRTGVLRHWPWFTLFVLAPAGGAAVMAMADLAPEPTAGLLAGIGILGGLLFQVLAWISSRIAALADNMGERAATRYELALVQRLDIARANIAYASFVSVTYAIGLGVVSMLSKSPKWVNVLAAFVLLHLGATLVLVLVRINRIGKNDRVAALTAHARSQSS